MTDATANGFPAGPAAGRLRYICRVTSPFFA